LRKPLIFQQGDLYIIVTPHAQARARRRGSFYPLLPAVVRARKRKDVPSGRKVALVGKAATLLVCFRGQRKERAEVISVLKPGARFDEHPDVLVIPA